ncbi:YneF family protein [Mycoplasma bradburyae]|uniref:YneF family protein n=1 Tax=Mycoplasma bradburyae TaxID=2963128 RepID=A0AAW6HRK6_9MOLU|nr:YneF family protein [Mycoplasma bradburyae]MDC4163010.1 YneF family protein [Mycoplasma bradburyae]MDC4182348.1 YneF family protein [Mycoplasma bradburyae]MDC4183074.1 YneF family protein [Mycoplasma bradburyae]MDC4183792.1 YneF family protein [Mycoplasma bradburyae]UTS70690.1 YneF family protein [Mycoplasma bradburyae]
MELALSLGLSIPLCLIAGAILGYIIAIKVFKRQMRKNPPITEAQIRSLYAQMGRKPSEAQVKQMMRAYSKEMK